MKQPQDTLLDEAREWLQHLRETGVDGHSILSQLIARMEPKADLVELNVNAREGEGTQVNAVFKGEAVKAFAASWIDWFRSEGAHNFITVDIRDPQNSESYSITMQKAGGKTPAQALAEQRAARDPVAQKIAARDVHYQLIEKYGLTDTPAANCEVRDLLVKLAAGE